MDQLSFIMNELQIDILGISETKLNSTVNDYELHIDGYDLIRKDQETDRGCGIAIYIRSNISYTSCPNLQDNNTETLWINVQLTKSLKFLLCMFYRPPSARVSYRETFINNCDKATSTNSNIVVIGDFNCNMLNITKNETNNWMKDLCTLYKFEQLVKDPTRVTPISSTLIDLILTSMPEYHTNTDLIKVTLSDHYLTLSNIKPFKNTTRNLIYRSFKTFNDKLLTSRFNDKLPPWNLPDSVYTFQIEPISREFISKQLTLLTLLGNRANTDILGIDAKLLHISREYMSSSLCSFYNISLNEGYVPDDWKTAKITPIYKGKGSKLDPSNYRPISVISHVSKVIERFINKQCLTYLESYNLLSVQQSAFLKQNLPSLPCITLMISG